MSDFWICIGDIHDEIARLKDIPELAQARGVIISGDLTMAKGIPKKGGKSRLCSLIWSS